jgi:hypothetical protein
VRRRLILTALALLAWLASGEAPRAGEPAGGSDASAAPTSLSVLGHAFANRYQVNLTSKINLVMQNRTGQERRRRFHAVTMLIDDRVHSLGRLVWPNHLRGMTILTIEAENRSHDAFVYLPSLEKTRRITTAQRAETFLGSDVTYEDLERRRVEEYDLAPLETGSHRGEPVYVIRARSRRDFSYSHVVFHVARGDGAILLATYFKSGTELPFRLIEAPRPFMVERRGHVLPTRLIVRNRLRGTTTRVEFEELKVDPPIDPHIFSSTTLDLQRDLPL